jgi:hypothetical protein
VNDSKTDRISFGRTGGFTNMTVEYALFGNGKVYRVKDNDLVKFAGLKRSGSVK